MGSLFFKTACCAVQEHLKDKWERLNGGDWKYQIPINYSIEINWNFLRQWRKFSFESSIEFPV